MRPAWEKHAIAVVSGDDVLSQLPSWIDEGLDLAHMETGRPISEVLDRLVSANAYLGRSRSRGDSLDGADRRDGARGRCILDAGAGGRGVRVDVGRLAEARGPSVAGHVIEMRRNR